MVDALFVDGTGTPFAELPVVDATTGAALGTDGASPPVIPGTGVRGWLRSVYDRLDVGVPVTNIKSLPSLLTGQGDVSGVAASYPPTPGMTSRSTVRFTNPDPTVDVYFSESSAKLTSQADILMARSSVEIDLYEGEAVWWRTASGVVRLFWSEVGGPVLGGSFVGNPYGSGIYGSGSYGG